MSVLGIDPSLTSTGYAWFGLDDEWHVGTIQPGERKGVERLRHIHDTLDLDILSRARPALAVLEGYSRGSSNWREEAGELGGVIRLLLHRARIPFAVVAPDTNKKFATGDGHASKAAMQNAAFKRAGQEFHPRKQGEDEADAWWLANMGLCHLGTPLFDLPLTQRAQVAKPTWPEMNREAGAA